MDSLTDTAAPVNLVKNIFKGVSGLFGPGDNVAPKLGTGILGSTGAAAQSLIPNPADLGSKFGDIAPKPGQTGTGTGSGIQLPQVGQQFSSQLGSLAASMSGFQLLLKH